MRSVDAIGLGMLEKEALKRLTDAIRACLGIDSMFIFGSVVRGDADAESDIDLLVVTQERLTRGKRHTITDIVFDVNLRYGTNFSSLVVDKHSWTEGLVSVLPLHAEILREGVAV